ncbi:MAG: glycogen-binding domain-containing protein [Candidatus Omnitrophica bacterium]|nr:glycogen-binding domain-containing protein [Candidatus Omnitrophota bacterium]
MKITKVLKPSVAKKSAGKKVDFQLTAPDAKKVALTGDFNSWNTNGTKMKKDRNGVWSIGMTLNPGRYEYKFIVDGQWWTDPINSNTSKNSFGTINSVLEVGA